MFSMILVGLRAEGYASDGMIRGIRNPASILVKLAAPALLTHFARDNEQDTYIYKANTSGVERNVSGEGGRQNVEFETHL